MAAAGQKAETPSMHHPYSTSFSRLQSIFFAIENALSLSALLLGRATNGNTTAHKVVKLRLPVLVVDLAMSPQKDSILVETFQLSRELRKYLFTKRRE